MATTTTTTWTSAILSEALAERAIPANLPKQVVINLVNQDTGGVVADTGMDGICEIQRGCVAAKINDLALGCKDKNLVGKQVRFSPVEKFH